MALTTSDASRHPRVLVAVLTFQRPDGLRRAVESVLDDLADGPALDVEILVVDNDPMQSARPVLEALHVACPLIRYICEPKPGISHARNAALAAAVEGFEFLAFIDDDEDAEKGWIRNLLSVQHCYGADAVAGPVLPRLGAGAPGWVAEGRFFERPRHPTGTVVDYAGTGNVLISVAAIQALGLRFSPVFALTGGEDTHFFSQLRNGGGRLVWSDEAVVWEGVSPTRATTSWICMRAYRSGAALSLSELLICEPKWWVATRRFWKGCANIVVGVSSLPLALSGGQARFVAALRNICRGWGQLTGLLGTVHEEYGRR